MWTCSSSIRRKWWIRQEARRGRTRKRQDDHQRHRAAAREPQDAAGWLTTITNQALADDPQHGWFLTQQVKDRTIADYAGQWRSVYPLLKNGKLRGVMEHKAATGDKTADEYTAYYDAGYKTDTETITIEGDRMAFTTNGRKVTATYRYDGHRILDYAKGNRGVRYLFTATGDVPQGAPKAVQFSDHASHLARPRTSTSSPATPTTR